MPRHHFISYSTKDAQEFAFRLHDKLEGGPPSIPAWLDKRDIKPGENWEQKIDEAIRDCHTLLFVMTPDSVDYRSVCYAEWSRALRFKRIVVPLLLDRRAVAPMRLQDRQWIDFSEDFDSALAQLRDHLNWLASPAGELHALKDRYADAERDLARTDDDRDRKRIETEMSELREDIARQQALVDDPAGVKARAEASIKARIETERKPREAPRHTTKFINPPPMTAPTYFQDRFPETHQIADFLRDESLRLLTLVGTGGIGKTATVCRVLKALHSGKLPDDLGELPVDGIVYLSTGAGPYRVSGPTLFAGLSKLLPADAATAFDAIYRDARTSTADKMRALLGHFANGRVIVLLDNFEDVVAPESRTLTDADVDEALRALLAAPSHAVKVLITTRARPGDLVLECPERQRVYDLDTGLESPYAENILRAMDDDGALGLKDAPDATLSEARELTRGFPRALEALVAILRSDRETRLDDLLADLRAWTERDPDAARDNAGVSHVVQKLVGDAFNRLDTPARQVMQALAIYNRPVPAVAVDYLLQPFAPGLDAVKTLKRLVNMHFARRDEGHYYLHPVDCAYALSLVPCGEKSDRFERVESPFTQIALYERGAAYFRSARKPREQWKSLPDLDAQLAEIDLRIAAEDFDTAADVLNDISFDYLLLWGHSRLMVELHGRLQGKISAPGLRIRSLNSLGLACNRIGRVREAIGYYETALTIAREREDKGWEGALLGGLGNAYRALGEVRRAIEYHEQALVISREIGDRRGEGADLGNLGSAYSDLGEVRRAIEYYEQALTIDREIGNRRGEGADLGNLGSAYSDLGEVRRAIEYYEQALTIAREIGDRLGERVLLGNLGECFVALGEYERGLEHHRQALAIAREIQYPSGASINLGNIGSVHVLQSGWSEASQALTDAIQIADGMGFVQTQNEARHTLALAHLLSDDLVAAREAIEAARRYDYPTNNYNVYALYGIIALRQGDHAVAQAAFADALTAADDMLTKTAENYDALDARGLALAGLALLADAPDVHIAGAVAAYRAARAITSAPGIVARALQLFDALAAVDDAGLLAGVRAAATGEL